MKRITSNFSPNFNERKLKINTVVIHYTGMETFSDALINLCNPSSKVSSHYLIDYSGEIYLLVDEEKRAWHAGVSSWKGIKDINSCSIGIELANRGHDFVYEPFPEEQMISLETLLIHLMKKYDISPFNIVGHSDVAPLRKKDPGELFNWKRLANKGLAIYPEKLNKNLFKKLSAGDQGKLVEILQVSLKEIGYGVNINSIYDSETKLVVKAFQRRFRNRMIDGIVDEETGKLITCLKMLTINDTNT